MTGLLQDGGVGDGPSLGTEPSLWTGLWSRRFLWEEVLEETAGSLFRGLGEYPDLRVQRLFLYELTHAHHHWYQLKQYKNPEYYYCEGF